MSDESGDDKPKFRVIETGGAAEETETEHPNLEEAVNDEAVLLKVRALEEEHRDLDQAIVTMEERMPYDRLTLQRMKKRKLALKDRIAKLKGAVRPDIIA